MQKRVKETKLVHLNYPSASPTKEKEEFIVSRGMKSNPEVSLPTSELYL
ncbi:17021_t:CDS:2 [Funneliformis geosporum]|uniref:2363_t:CDS:1 n=1 Tax=Funneliformis geosporum TaxID=1117311 RepID=A0A9W4WN03_9GLOM|nr:17021_t:CDS:2 [Funneliformis geosporum]CAI2173486.1 2363_t:CDS:2 [Funneliformis geosporum]